MVSTWGFYLMTHFNVGGLLFFFSVGLVEMEDGILVLQEHSELWITSRQIFNFGFSPEESFPGFQVPSCPLHFLLASTLEFLVDYAEVLPV